MALVLMVVQGALLCCGRGEPRDQRAKEVSQRDTVALKTEPARVSKNMEWETVQNLPDTTGVATGPGGRELHPAQLPAGAYQACKASAAVRLPDPQRAIWGNLPDKVERASTGEYALVGQVRPDSASPGLSFLCVLTRAGNTWRVVNLEMSH
jgi:hypothetical protein